MSRITPNAEKGCRRGPVVEVRAGNHILRQIVPGSIRDAEPAPARTTGELRRYGANQPTNYWSPEE